MLGNTILLAFLKAAIIAEASTLPRVYNIQSRQSNGRNNNGNNGGNGASRSCLNADVLQTASFETGQDGADVESGQVESLTDNANFINFCFGKTLTNGLQIKEGSCNGIAMGDIPSTSNMVSNILLNPKHNDVLAPEQDFDIELQVNNLQAGFFTNPQANYYSAPQQLNGQGSIIGHVHVTVQDLGNSLNPQNPLDASQFAFFKGINDAGNGNGLLKATVAGGLPPGNYRVCTIAAAMNHQPVLMPVAQRGAQDDCNKFTVSAGNNNNNNGDNGNNNSNNNDGGNNNNGSNNNSGGNSNGSNNNNGGNNNGSNNNGGNNSGNGGASSANAIGGIAAPSVEDSGNSSRPFSVNGNSFVNKGAAIQRACDIQNNACSDAVNKGQIRGATVGDCQQQMQSCIAEIS